MQGKVDYQTWLLLGNQFQTMNISNIAIRSCIQLQQNYVWQNSQLQHVCMIKYLISSC